MRVAIVERCSPDECPYCRPDVYRISINHCTMYKNSQKVSARLKTFPHICPLLKLKEIKECE
jgi:hypothetical protein